MILAVATIDYIDHLKKYSTGWVFEPLVVLNDDKLTHERFVTVRTRPNNRVSPYEFYLDNAPTGISTLIKAAKKGHYPRVIEIRLDRGPTSQVSLRYWRVNGWRQNEVSHKRFYSHRYAPVQQSGETSFRVYAMDRVTKGNKKRKAIIHRDVMDLAAADDADRVSQTTVMTLEKSLVKAHGGGRREKLRNWGEKLAIVMDGKNFLYGGFNNDIRAEVVYG